MATKEYSSGNASGEYITSKRRRAYWRVRRGEYNGEEDVDEEAGGRRLVAST
jgi:hypothetical protein